VGAQINRFSEDLNAASKTIDYISFNSLILCSLGKAGCAHWGKLTIFILSVALTLFFTGGGIMISS